MNEIFKKPVVVGIIAAAILIALGWNVYSKNAQERKASEEAKKVADEIAKNGITNLTNVDAADFDEVVKTEYALANEKALEADAANQFSALVVELPGDLSIAGGNNRYIFSSSSNASVNWCMTISQKTQSYIRALIPKEDYLGELKPIDATLWKFNYVTALQIAEKNGGSAWREKNSSPDSVTLTLRYVEADNKLLWTVEYAKASNNLVLKIDSNSGKIVES